MRGIGLLMAIGVTTALAAPATSFTPPSLEVEVPALYLSADDSLKPSGAQAGPCGTPLVTPAASGGGTFTWATPPVSGAYHGAGGLRVTVAYVSTDPAAAAPPAGAGITTTVRVLFGSTAVGEDQQSIPAGAINGPTRHEIEIAGTPQAAAGSKVVVEVLLEPAPPADGAPAGVPADNVAIACGDASLLDAFKIVAGTPGDGDLDGDGIPDAEDLDVDGDGVPNADEAAVECVGADGTPIDLSRDPRLMPGDHDADQDGFTDEQECAAGADPLSLLSTPPDASALGLATLAVLGLVAFARRRRAKH